MAGGGGCAWSRKLAARMRTLRGLVRDTHRALQDVYDILNFDSELITKVQEIGNISSRSTALVILGTTSSARVRLLHCLLGRKLLPDPMPRGCRWLRIQYGNTTQVHLTLGNSEFELVEELESNKRAWDILPMEDLLRQEQTDLTTVLEVELNIPFLKNGLKIVIPPDIDSNVDYKNHRSLKQAHSEWYAKRDSILRNLNPIYFYALDRTGRNVFSELCCSKINSSRIEEDFWTTFDLYHMTCLNNENGNEVRNEEVMDNEVWMDEIKVPYVFTAENCLDLHQIKEINPNSQLLFILFSDSADVASEEFRRRSLVEDGFRCCVEATESTDNTVYNTEELPESDQDLMQDGLLRHTYESPEHSKTIQDDRRLYEEQIAFMNELLEQWELMSSPPLKHYVKSQWMILDDIEILHTYDQKVTPFVSDTFSKGCNREIEDERTVRNRSTLLTKVIKFATDCMQSYLLEYCTKLSEIHVKLLQQFILASFDLARELQVVPKKIQYIAKQEQQLYETINEKFSEGDKKQELVQIMHEVLQEMKTEVNNMDWSVDDLPCHQDKRFTLTNSVFYSSSRNSPVSVPLQHRDTSVGLPDRTDLTDASDVEEAESYDSYNFDDYEIIHSNDESLAPSEYYKFTSKQRPDDTISLSSQIGQIHVENESEMFSLSSIVRRVNNDTDSVTTCTNTLNLSMKQASLDVQQTVLSKLSRKISLKLVKFIDCLRDTYFGTLQRCVESLEWSCRAELGGRPATEAVRRLLSCARQVQLQPTASFSLLRTLLNSLRRLLYRLHIVDGEAEGACCVLSPVWRRQVATQTIQSLSPQRLARVISAQILERLSVAHERYQSALSSLEAALANRLHHTEDVKLAIRKKYAPSFARLCLESTSMCDLLMYGTPDLGFEIGRGQYGVVYSVRGSWAGHSPAAVKSVLPADERHYHELAMEFFYTRSIPIHPRIVRLYGSIVQRHSGGGPTVLLVSGRYCRDLHTAVRTGLDFARRMRVSCDIIEGIRYLHSLGLVHRDITMKNVLLDTNDRAALSDLGFCTAEALMSGSVVGTPVHMAPELFAGEYDAAVDVYAFGILFWFVCAGNIRLPSAFEVCQKNKEQLWSRVRRGLRPERLPYFTDDCWSVMESCWASEPSQRALLGDIQPKLEKILEEALNEEHNRNEQYQEKSDVSDTDSLYMTGIKDSTYNVSPK